MADKRIVDLTALVTSDQAGTDIYEISDFAGILPSRKESRDQMLIYSDANAQLASSAQVTGLTAQLAGKADVNGDNATGTWPISITGNAATVTINGGVQNVVVAQDGVNAVGNGTVTNPYATPIYAQTQITTAGSSKPYSLNLLSGDYTTGGNFSLKPWVSIGAQENVVWDITGTFGLDSSWSSQTQVLNFISNLRLTGPTVNFNFNSLSAQGAMFFDNVIFDGTAATVNITMTGLATAPSSAFFEQVTQVGVVNFSGTDINGDCIGSQFNNFSLTSTSNATIEQFNISNCTIGGTLTLAATGSQTLFVNLNATKLNNLPVLDGNVILTTDSASYIGPPIATGGAVYALTNYSSGILSSYNPTNYTVPTNATVDEQFAGIDAALGTSPSLVPLQKAYNDSATPAQIQLATGKAFQVLNTSSNVTLNSDNNFTTYQGGQIYEALSSNITLTNVNSGLFYVSDDKSAYNVAIHSGSGINTGITTTFFSNATNAVNLVFDSSVTVNGVTNFGTFSLAGGYNGTTLVCIAPNVFSLNYEPQNNLLFLYSSFKIAAPYGIYILASTLSASNTYVPLGSILTYYTSGPSYNITPGFKTISGVNVPGFTAAASSTDTYQFSYSLAAQGTDFVNYQNYLLQACVYPSGGGSIQYLGFINQFQTPPIGSQITPIGCVVTGTVTLNPGDFLFLSYANVSNTTAFQFSNYLASIISVSDENASSNIIIGLPTAGNIPIGSGSNFVSTAVSGDATLNSSGVVAVTGINSNPLGSTTPTNGNILKANGTQWATAAPAALTGSNDTNITVTLGGSASTALINSASLTMGWTGTLAAARLNSNVVQAITNDTNVTGSISGQNLTLGWTGTLAPTRLSYNTTNLQNSSGALNTIQNISTGSSPQFAGITIQSTGFVDPTVKSTTTGSTNTADWQLVRGDQANGFARIKYGTGAGYDWSAGTRSGSSNYQIFDEFDATSVVNITQGSGTSSTVAIAGNLTTGNTITTSNGHHIINTVGYTLKIKGGSNSCLNIGAVLVGGTVTVSNSAIATGDIILTNCTSAGGTQGIITISIVNATSYTLTSSSPLDASTYSCVIIKAA